MCHLLQKDSRLHEPVPSAQHNAENGEEDMQGERLQQAAELPPPHGARQGDRQHVHRTG